MKTIKYTCSSCGETHNPDEKDDSELELCEDCTAVMLKDWPLRTINVWKLSKYKLNKYKKALR